MAPYPGAHGRLRLRLGIVSLIAIFALYALPPLLAPRNFPSDDSLFYLQVARQIAAGHGSTFNTITPTNGYHPLWMGPCVAAAWLAGGDPDRLLRLAFAMQILLAAGCLLLFRAVARRLGIRAWPLGIPILAAYFLTGMYGAEAHVNGFCVLASLLALLRARERPDAGGWAALGFLLGLTILARLDNVFLVAAMIVAAGTVVPGRPSARLARMARVLAPMAVVVTPYLVWNLARFGHLVPISGAIKSTFPRVSGDWRNLGVLGLACFVVAVCGAAALSLGRIQGARRPVVGAMTAGVLAQGLYIVLFTSHHTHWSWYYVVGVLLTTILLCLAADAITARSALLRSRAVAVFAVALLTTAGLARGWARYRNSGASSHNQLVVRFLHPAANDRWEIQLARHLDRVLPSGAGVLAFDYPGHLAFYSSLRVVAADGLVDDYRYDAMLRRRGLETFLSDHDIGYYVGRDLDPPDSCRSEPIFAPLSKVDVGALRLCPGNLVAATRSVVRGVPAPDVAAFRIGEIEAPRGMPEPPIAKHGSPW